jgi:D-sedoheptulose 7-phosphate isomerase
MDATSINETFRRGLRDSISLKEKVFADEKMIETSERIASRMVEAFKGGNKVLFCGNGGSAADAQHLAAELSGRYYFDRAPLAAEALHVNTSYLTAVANDYSYDEIYSRLIRGLGKPGDMLVGLSTSGNSANVVKALQTAHEMGMTTVGFTGESGGAMKEACDLLISIPSKDTPRIQECHMLLGHLICEVVEASLFARES